MAILNELENILENKKVNPDFIHSHVYEIHGRPEDWGEGDLSDRIYNYEYYDVKNNIPLSKVDLEEWDVDDDYVDEIKSEIEKTNNYEPIVVGEEEGVTMFTIIDGIHRLNALNQLGYKNFKGYIGRL